MQSLMPFFLIPLIVFPGNCKGEEEKVTPLILKLKSEDEKESKQAYDAILSGRQKAIQALIAIVADENLRLKNPKAVGRAIRILGGMCANEATDLLTKMLLFSDLPYPDPWRLQSSEELYPAVSTLIKIGKPAIKPLLKMVSEGAFSVQEVKKAGLIIKEIEGVEIGRERVRLYAKELKNEDERKRLEDPVFYLFLKEP